MKRRETSNFKAANSSLCFFLMAGLLACNTGREAAEDRVVLNGTEAEVDVPSGALVTESVAESLDEDKFYTTFSNTAYYEEWDADDDGFLSEEEFATGFYQTWDTDKDGRVSQSEWDTAVADFAVDASNWKAWDPDGDGYIEKAEFETEFALIHWYEPWDLDKDKRINEREYTSGVFRIWDTDGDNLLDKTWYINFGKYYGN